MNENNGTKFPVYSDASKQRWFRCYRRKTEYSLHERVIYLAIVFTLFTVMLACLLSDCQKSSDFWWALTNWKGLNNSFFPQVLYLRQQFSIILFHIISNLHSMHSINVDECVSCSLWFLSRENHVTLMSCHRFRLWLIVLFF